MKAVTRNELPLSRKINETLLDDKVCVYYSLPVRLEVLEFPMLRIKYELLADVLHVLDLRPAVSLVNELQATGHKELTLVLGEGYAQTHEALLKAFLIAHSQKAVTPDLITIVRDAFIDVSKRLKKARHDTPQLTTAYGFDSEIVEIIKYLGYDVVPEEPVTFDVSEFPISDALKRELSDLIDAKNSNALPDNWVESAYRARLDILNYARETLQVNFTQFNLPVVYFMLLEMRRIELQLGVI